MCGGDGIRTFSAAHPRIQSKEWGAENIEKVLHHTIWV